MKYVGAADPRAVVETEKGLLVQGKLDIANGNAVADQVYKLMKQRLLKGWSFGYTVPEGGEKMDEKGVNEVSEVDLVEVGPTLKGANPKAELAGDQVRAGGGRPAALDPARGDRAGRTSTRRKGSNDRKGQGDPRKAGRRRRCRRARKGQGRSARSAQSALRTTFSTDWSLRASTWSSHRRSRSHPHRSST